MALGISNMYLGLVDAKTKQGSFASVSDSATEVCGPSGKGVKLFDKHLVGTTCWFVDRECLRAVN